MKKIIALFILILLIVACKNEVSPEGSHQPKVIPDHTPYIIGLIQYSPDTTFHYPEVVVGYFTDTQAIYSSSQSLQKLRNLGILVSKHLHPKLHYKGLYSIMLTMQLTTISTIFSLSWQPESHAIVTVRGPLGTPQERKVTFIAEGNGVYGDVKDALPRVANGRYKLRVTLPDGREYAAQTYIPDSMTISFEDSIRTEVDLAHQNNGAPRERATGNKGYSYTYNPPQSSFITVIQYNSNIDRRLFLLEPGQKFRYAGYGNYLRRGMTYVIGFTNDSIQTANITWQQNLTKPRDEIWNSEHFWLRYSFFSTGIGKEFIVPFIWATGSLEYFKGFGNKPGHAAEKNDTTYLHRVSTILKVGKNGKVLPIDSSDAIGFFGGEYSRYLQTTLYPARTFDLDSVWNAWHNRNK